MQLSFATIFATLAAFAFATDTTTTTTQRATTQSSTTTPDSTRGLRLSKRVFNAQAFIDREDSRRCVTFKPSNRGYFLEENTKFGITTDKCQWGERCNTCQRLVKCRDNFYQRCSRVFFCEDTFKQNRCFKVKECSNSDNDTEMKKTFQAFAACFGRDGPVNLASFTKKQLKQFANDLKELLLACNKAPKGCNIAADNGADVEVSVEEDDSGFAFEIEVRNRKTRKEIEACLFTDQPFAPVGETCFVAPDLLNLLLSPPFTLSSSSTSTSTSTSSSTSSSTTTSTTTSTSTSTTTSTSIATSSAPTSGASSTNTFSFKFTPPPSTSGTAIANSTTAIP
eukprot:m.136475 g.136475  ORF g.136475 m.136475 type:complete len:338 (-) comp16023_c2_seq9:96-1109(-)